MNQEAERIYLSPPLMGPLERDMLLEAFDSNWVTSVGRHIDGFEEELAASVGVRRAVAVSSGTAALHLALRCIGVGPGDRVIVPSYTFAASANAVVYVGAEPVFIDCCAETWTIDPDLLVEAIDRRSILGTPIKAVVTVDLFGQCCDYDQVQAVSRERGVILLEDAAEALGSTYGSQMAGSFGDAGVLSFNGNKIITSGGGGALLTNIDSIADEARYLANQARDPVPHYEHRAVGYNYRMNNMLAALGRAQLAHLPERVRARREVFAEYERQFCDVPGISLMPQAPYGDSNCWLTCIVVDPVEFGATAEEVMVHLAGVNIEARPTWKPMHLQPVFAGATMIGGSVCEGLFSRALCLPSGSNLTRSQQDRVVSAVRSMPRGGPHGGRSTLSPPETADPLADQGGVEVDD